MSIGLGNADVDRQIGAAVECYVMRNCQTPLPINFGQTINTERAAKPTAIDRDSAVGERLEIDIA